MSDGGYYIEGYLVLESGRFIKAAELAATERNRDLILAGKIIPLMAAPIPPAIRDFRPSWFF
jgi:hypothetical protein